MYGCSTNTPRRRKTVALTDESKSPPRPRHLGVLPETPRLSLYIVSAVSGADSVSCFSVNAALSISFILVRPYSAHHNLVFGLQKNTRLRCT